MKRVHEHLTGWMERAGMTVRLDQAANLIGHYPAEGGRDNAPVVLIGSHLDTVPNAGKYDGMLGVLLGLAAVEALGGRRLPFALEVVGFSEEEGVRFRTPYLGSLALCGRFDPADLDLVDDAGVTMADAFRQFGLDPHPADRGVLRGPHRAGAGAGVVGFAGRRGLGDRRPESTVGHLRKEGRPARPPPMEPSPRPVAGRRRAGAGCRSPGPGSRSRAREPSERSRRAQEPSTSCRTRFA